MCCQCISLITYTVNIARRILYALHVVFCVHCILYTLHSVSSGVREAGKGSRSGAADSVRHQPRAPRAPHARGRQQFSCCLRQQAATSRSRRHTAAQVMRCNTSKVTRCITAQVTHYACLSLSYYFYIIKMVKNYICVVSKAINFMYVNRDCIWLLEPQYHVVYNIRAMNAINLKCIF